MHNLVHHKAAPVRLVVLLGSARASSQVRQVGAVETLLCLTLMHCACAEGGSANGTLLCCCHTAQGDATFFKTDTSCLRGCSKLHHKSLLQPSGATL